jgi:hypothetical protein
MSGRVKRNLRYGGGVHESRAAQAHNLGGINYPAANSIFA